MEAGDKGRAGGGGSTSGARCGQTSTGLNRFSNKNKVKTGSDVPWMHAAGCVRAAPPLFARPSIRFSTGYIQTGKNPVLSQVGCGSREPQINLRK